MTNEIADSRTRHRYLAVFATLVMAIAFGAIAQAQPSRARGDNPRSENQRGDNQRGDDRHGAPHGYVFDSRYHHDRYYPPRGFGVARIDRGARWVPYANGRYYYRGGAWYRPVGSRFVVVAAPLGLVIPFLPDFYTTVWFGGVPYYYANDTYYTWRRQARGYVVVEPPASAPSDRGEPLSAEDDFFVYPRSGQSEELQSRDRFECHRWAVSQTGFDPTEPGGGVAESQNSSKRADYRRAITACLEGRGYSVK